MFIPSKIIKNLVVYDKKVKSVNKFSSTNESLKRLSGMHVRVQVFMSVYKEIQKNVSVSRSFDVYLPEEGEPS